MRSLSGLLVGAVLMALAWNAQGAVGAQEDISSQEFTSEVKQELRQWDERLAMVKAGALSHAGGEMRVHAVESDLEALREGVRRDLHFLKVQPHLSPRTIDVTRSRIRSRLHRMDIEYQGLGMN